MDILEIVCLTMLYLAATRSDLAPQPPNLNPPAPKPFPPLSLTSSSTSPLSLLQHKVTTTTAWAKFPAASTIPMEVDSPAPSVVTSSPSVLSTMLTTAHPSNDISQPTMDFAGSSFLVPNPHWSPVFLLLKLLLLPALLHLPPLPLDLPSQCYPNLRLILNPIPHP